MEANGCKPYSMTYWHLKLKEVLKASEMGMNKVLSFQVRRSTSASESTRVLLEGFVDMVDFVNAKKLFQ